jgi:hypothetical protein
MSRYGLYVRLVLIVLVVGSLALALGSDPWGPH